MEDKCESGGRRAQEAAAERGQINDSFTCRHCKNDGFDAIASAKDASQERTEIY